MLIGLLCVKKFNINEKCSINLQFYSVRRQLDVILTILQKMYASNMITITAGISKTEEGIQIATYKAKKKRTHHHIEAFLPMNKQARSTWAKKRETALYISPNKPHANTASGKIRKNACYSFSGGFFFSLQSSPFSLATPIIFLLWCEMPKKQQQQQQQKVNN